MASQGQAPFGQSCPGVRDPKAHPDQNDLCSKFTSGPGSGHPQLQEGFCGVEFVKGTGSQVYVISSEEERAGSIFIGVGKAVWKLPGLVFTLRYAV